MIETEIRNLETAALDKKTTREMLSLIQKSNEESVRAVEVALPKIAIAVEIATQTIVSGGRIIYVGAGSSGRLAILDASECPTTFGVDDSTVVALIAGGRDAVFKAEPAVEDSLLQGRSDMLGLLPTSRDFVIGLSASGGAAYVVGALDAARESGSSTASVSSNYSSPISRCVDVEIVTPTGAEPIAGSTRMKAGNAQKMVLNMISTGAMVKSGKVMGNLMINLRPLNDKLRRRMIGIVSEIANVSADKALALLETHGWSIPEVLETLSVKFKGMQNG